MSAIEADSTPSQGIKYTADQQGSEIPLGWKPTPSKPVPVVRCRHIRKDGSRCKNWSLRGYIKCKRHAGPGAQTPDGNVTLWAAAVVEAGRLRIIDEADPAIDQLVALMQPGTAEAIRLKAATEVLDRAGIRGGFEISVDADITAHSAASEIEKRLAELKEGAAAVRRLRGEEDTDSDIVEGEIIEDPDQPALFDLAEDEEPTDD